MEAYELVELEEGIASVVRSPRGHNLVLSTNYEWKTCGPVLTVELYVKWYELFLITWSPHELTPDASRHTSDLFKLHSIHYGHLESCCLPRESAFCDHVPNPAVVRRFVARENYHLDEIAEELIEGRWKMEYTDSMVWQCPSCEGTGRVRARRRDRPEPNYITCPACEGTGANKTGA